MPTTEAKNDRAVGGSGGDGDGCEGEEDGEQDSDGDRGDSDDGDSETVSMASDSLIIFCVPGTGLKALYTLPPLNSHDLPVRWALARLSHSWGILGSQRASILLSSHSSPVQELGCVPSSARPWGTCCC